MKRDKDLVRQMLLAFEAGPASVSKVDRLQIEGRDTQELWHHLVILEDAGFIGRETVTITKGSSIFGEVQERKGGYRLTWKGHEFLETVRDPDVWQRTKDGASKIGNASIDILWQIAKAYAKQKGKEYLGVDLL